MMRLKILLFLMILAFTEVTCKCTASQSNKMIKCSASFFDSLGFYDDGNPDPVAIMFGLTTSWSNVENFCDKFGEMKKCLGPSVIENCVDLKKDVKSMSDYMDFGFGFIYIAGNYICGDGYATLEKMYECGLSRCKIDDSTCETTKESIKQCTNAAKKICDKHTIGLLETILHIKECFKNPDCGLCGDEKTDQRVKEYRAKMNVGKKVKDNTLKEFAKAAQSNDVDLQLDVITKLRKQFSGKKITKDVVVGEGFLPIFVKYLSSKSPEVQAEAASALKHFADKTQENLEAILEAEIIPALIRTLISTDENVLEKVIETLATIISKHPELRTLYMDLNIVESLLMSYTPDITSQMDDDMVQILIHLTDNNVISSSSKIKKYISAMLPTLAELIYNYDSNSIVSFIQLFDDNNILIDVKIIDSVYQLIFHQDEVIRVSAFFSITNMPKRETVIQHLLENGILKFIKNLLKEKNFESSLALSGLLFLSKVAEYEKRIDAIFDSGLIPYMISYLNRKYDSELRILATLTLVQISKHGKSEHLATLVDSNIIPAICEALQNSDLENYIELYVHMNGIMIINNLSENNKEAVIQFKENNGEYLVKRLLQRDDIKPNFFKKLSKTFGMDTDGMDVKNIDRDEL